LQSFLYTNGTAVVIDMGRKIIHPACAINELPERKTFTHLFNRAMYVSQMWFNLLYGFSIQRNNKVQHSMC